MAILKLLVFSIFLSLLCVRIKSNRQFTGEETIVSELPGHSSLQIELQELKGKISALESSVEEKIRESKEKDESIAYFEKILKEKVETISSLENEITLLQRKGNIDAEKKVGEAHARADTLNKQVKTRNLLLETLKAEIKMQNSKRAAFEAQATDAEKKLQILNSKIENALMMMMMMMMMFYSYCTYLMFNKLQRINDEQKSRIRKTELALHAAEEEMIKAQLEVAEKSKELVEAYGAWFPPWLTVHLLHLESFVSTNWNEHGKAFMNIAVAKVCEKSVHLQKWSEPSMEIIKTKWIPAVKEQWVTITTIVEPHVETVIRKSSEIYETSKNSLALHVVKVHELADPYFQEAKKFSKPYIDQGATAVEPHVSKVRMILKPHIDKLVYAYGNFLKSATMHHHQVQNYIQETLKKNELLEPFATKELVWFLASAALVIPCFIPCFLLNVLCFCTLCKKSKKSIQMGDTSKGHPHKHKRRVASK